MNEEIRVVRSVGCDSCEKKERMEKFGEKRGVCMVWWVVKLKN